MKNKVNSRIWLKTLRKKSGYTQEELAEKLGMPKTTYSSYEQGHRTPSVETCKVIADELGVSWTIFFDEKVRETYFKNDKKAGVK
ncbi:helix-turn-helix domain-containing protein [Tetragenococcus halophilus]|uniref:Xre family DNA-binding protein n=1 Tax=Tetragenococcus halophilus (strain DSM 20338 / JCM 20259 / NCIMB 9735 / NBRC 12172) TaxID=945021 RepID=A0AAN1VQM2_TETHN|nr:helix-turn-helix transcriptional regulator [Tetragenococcus halophilus]MCO8292622.1 helix-turn-helix transcriptional regulator [Tetragenococcus halophilus]BAK94159.1 putative Xre family DNA-binding protein [Tetragenococcus halophilus NBRC 12172]GBD70794.1 putative Xre family DNA-binding protein [Tetragenococcus halophilus subsp. halophilus]